MRAITALGHGLGMTITAEGVETEEQRAAVRDFGCTNLQGYLFGRPLAKTDFEREHLSGLGRRGDLTMPLAGMRDRAAGLPPAGRRATGRIRPGAMPSPNATWRAACPPRRR